MLARSRTISLRLFGRGDDLAKSAAAHALLRIAPQSPRPSGVLQWRPGEHLPDLAFRQEGELRLIYLGIHGENATIRSRPVPAHRGGPVLLGTAREQARRSASSVGRGRR